MTLADYRELRKEPEEEHPVAEAHEAAHPGPLEYAKIGVVLAVVTALEFAALYAGLGRWLLVFILVVLSALKFGLVGLWFMHLKFDNRLFSGMFVGGLLLAISLFIVVLATLEAGLF